MSATLYALPQHTSHGGPVIPKAAKAEATKLHGRQVYQHMSHELIKRLKGFELELGNEFVITPYCDLIAFGLVRVEVARNDGYDVRIVARSLLVWNPPLGWVYGNDKAG